MAPAVLLALALAAPDFKPDQSKLPVAPPKGATVLLGEKGEHSFLSMAGEKANWPVDGDAIVSTAKKNQNHIVSKLHVKDADIHVEFLLPENGPANSGVYIHGNYEVQILNSFGKEKITQEDAGAVYGFAPPLVNACRKPGEWQVLDIRYRAPRRDDAGKITENGTVTVWFNGQKVQDGTQFGEPKSTFHPFRFGNTPYLDAIRDRQKKTMTGPVFLQDHGNPVKFRNVWVLPADDRAFTYEPARFVDHSLLIAPEYPCTWPSHPFPRFAIVHQRKIGPESAYNIDVLLIDGNTGTQLDVPPHSVARPDLKREKSGPLGLAYTDKIEPWQFAGEACVVDVRDLLDKAPKGVSPLVKPEHVERFEKQHRQVRFGDVVLFRSDYSDKYYRPLPEGRRFIADVLDRKAPGYPDPDPDCMELLGKRGVLALGTDSASMGPLPDLAEPTHYAGLKYGMIWTEGATNLRELPATGAFYCFLGPKHEGGPYGEGRAFSISGGDLPKRLIESCRKKRAIDLSPALSPKLPLTSPGIGTGNHRQVYLKVDFLYSKYLDMWHHGHVMDATAGTHLVPPAYALPDTAEPVGYEPDVRGWLEQYEKKYGKRGSSKMTTEQVPLDWTCGEARVIDARSLVGTTKRRDWPASPEITVEHIKNYERNTRALRRGDVVIFQTGHTDKHLRPEPEDTRMWLDPLSGKAEGWPAPGPDAIVYLKEKGIRCVASDAPDLGGVDPQRALMTYWALGSREMVGVEMLVNVEKIPAEGAYFLFAAVKVRNCHGGPGRAIILY